MLTSGAVFHDEVGLQATRDRLAYYPGDVCLYLLVAGWWRVHPEMNLVGRAGAVGDELGSSLIGSRLVTDLMRLAFLMEQQHAPYSKWFGTAFSRLTSGPGLTPILSQVVRATTWQDREAALTGAYERLTELHNALSLTAPVSTELAQLWDRPFKVAWADIPDFLLPLVRDPAVVSIAQRWPVGPVDQFRHLLLGPAQSSPAAACLRVRTACLTPGSPPPPPATARHTPASRRRRGGCRRRPSTRRPRRRARAGCRPGPRAGPRRR